MSDLRDSPAQRRSMASDAFATAVPAMYRTPDPLTNMVVRVGLQRITAASTALGAVPCVEASPEQVLVRWQQKLFSRVS